MLLAKAKLLFLIAIWLLLLNLRCSESGEVSGDVMPSSPVACLNCTICQYPCHTPAPPLPGYPSYGTPPPPPPLSDYPSYGAPPPPTPPQLPTGGCPPSPVVQCCQYPPPAPATYGYVPYNNYSASSPSPLIFFFPGMISVFSFAALF